MYNNTNVDHYSLIPFINYVESTINPDNYLISNIVNQTSHLQSKIKYHKRNNIQKCI